MFLKRNILLFVGICVAMMTHAAVSKTVSVSAGGLSTALSAAEVASITNLTLTGSIDARDVDFIRDNIPNLSVLDMSAVTIHAYSGSAGTIGSNTAYSANEMPINSFSGKSTISSIVLPNSLASIGDWSFDACSGLSTLTIPGSVTSIGSYAFYGCSGIANMTIPNSVTSLGIGAFGACTKLTNITIGNSVKALGNDVFNGCTGLTSITIPGSVTSIGDWAFDGCTKLSSITTPNSVKSIGYGAFYGCTGLTSVTIGDAATLIGDWAFYGCSGMTTLTIGTSVSSIGDYAFGDCSGLTAVNSLDASPISLSSSVFEDVDKTTCTLYVPASSKSTYQVTSSWNEFSNIVGGNLVITGIEDTPTPKGEITIYPNPATDGIHIDGLEGTGTLTFSDVTGKMLLKQQVTASAYVPVSSLPSGLYIVRLATGKGIIESKVIKK